MIKIKTQSNTMSITDTAVQATPLVEEEVGHINVKVSKVRMRTGSELATDNLYVTAFNMIGINRIHKGVNDEAVRIYPESEAVAIPTLSGTYKYNGQTQYVTISAYDPEAVAVSGDTSASEIGTYTVVFSLIEPGMDVWVDGTTEDKTATWSIEQEYVDIPTIVGTYEYNGNEQTPTISEYDHTKINVSGISSQVNVGNYRITASLINPYVEWKDGTREDKTIIWTINKKTITIPTPSENQYYTGLGQYIEWEGDTSDADKISISYSDGDMKNAGTHPVQVSLLSTYQDNYQLPGGKLSVTITRTIKKTHIQLDSVTYFPGQQIDKGDYATISFSLKNEAGVTMFWANEDKHLSGSSSTNSIKINDVSSYNYLVEVSVQGAATTYGSYKNIYANIASTDNYYSASFTAQMAVS